MSRINQTNGTPTSSHCCTYLTSRDSLSKRNRLNNFARRNIRNARPVNNVNICNQLYLMFWKLGRFCIGTKQGPQYSFVF